MESIIGINNIKSLELKQLVSITKCKSNKAIIKQRIRLFRYHNIKNKAKEIREEEIANKERSCASSWIN
jgi:hypothetical protein